MDAKICVDPAVLLSFKLQAGALIIFVEAIHTCLLPFLNQFLYIHFLLILAFELQMALVVRLNV